MLSAFRPFRASRLPTLVMISTSSRRPRRASHLPITVSDSPPDRSGAHWEYESAVSMALKPRSTKRSSSLNEVASSAVQPKTLPPKTSGAISRPERPSVRFFMMFRLLYPGNVSGDGFNRAAVDPQCGTGGGAGLRRSRVDAEVGDLLRLGEVPEQVRGAIPGQEQAFHFQRSDAALGGQVGHHLHRTGGAGGAGQDRVDGNTGA